jgi:hypothetical protein
MARFRIAAGCDRRSGTDRGTQQSICDEQKGEDNNGKPIRAGAALPLEEEHNWIPGSGLLRHSEEKRRVGQLLFKMKQAIGRRTRVS